MVTAHNITYADRLISGGAYVEILQSLQQRRGAIISAPVLHYFGTPATADVDGIWTSATSNIGTLTLNGALVSGGVATIGSALSFSATDDRRPWMEGVARSVAIASSGDISTSNFTIVGTDLYGQTQRETIAGPNNTTVNTLKTFVTVTSVAVTTNNAGSAFTVGQGNKFGLPFRIDVKSQIVAVTSAGLSDTSATIVVANTAQTAASDGDARGTVTFNSAPNGSVEKAVMLIPLRWDKESLIGVTPYNG